MTLSHFSLIAALLFWQLHTPAFAQEEIRFKPGTVSGSVSGEVATTIKTYNFRAQKGQRITLTLEPAGGDKGMLIMTLYAYCGEEYGKPLVADALRWEGPLPCNDRYTIDIAPSVDAMKAARVQRYTLTLVIR